MAYTPPQNSTALTIPTYTGGNSPGILGYYAQQNGMSVSDLYNFNAGNPSVRSPNLILAGGTLYLPNRGNTGGAGTPPPTGTGTPVAGGTPPPGGTTTPPPTTSGSSSNAGYDSGNYRSYVDGLSRQISKEMSALERRRIGETEALRAAYEEASRIQNDRQNKEYAGRATSLVTSGGGFLGATQSQMGVLQNLSIEQQQERNALMAKRDAAIQAANNAYEDKRFGLAREKLELAKETEKELYNRQQDYADRQLANAKEARSADEYERNKAKDVLDSFTSMSDQEFRNIPQDKIKEIDALYYPGYTKNYRAIEKAAAEAKTTKDQTELDIKIANALRQIPAGTTVNLGGKTYVGMKKQSSGRTSGLISSQLAYQLGVPNLAGKDESDVILSLSFDTPPAWYKELYQSQNPEGWAMIANNPAAINADWKIFKSQPDIEAYKNSAVVTGRINKASSTASISQDDIAAAMASEE